MVAGAWLVLGLRAATMVTSEQSGSRGKRGFIFLYLINSLITFLVFFVIPARSLNHGAVGDSGAMGECDAIEAAKGIGLPSRERDRVASREAVSTAWSVTDG